MVNSGYELTAYFNTGFNGVDIPADASVLETATKRVYNDNYFLREDIDKPFIKVNDTYSNLRDCDYVKLTPKTGNTGGVTCYFFCVPTADAHGTTILALELDALLTMGGAKNLNYISGWQERGHIAKSEDEEFSNIAPENFTPNKPLICRAADIEIEGAGSASADLSVVVSTVDLSDVANYDEISVFVGVDQNQEEKMYIPKIKVNDNAHRTEFTTPVSYDENNDSYVSKSYKLPNTTAFVYANSDIQYGLSALFSAGQLSLMAAYVIPKEYVDAYSVYSDKQSAIMQMPVTGGKKIISADEFKYLYPINNYTVKNKKVYAMYNTYELLNVASGGASIINADKLYKSGDTAPKFIIWSDPSPSGKPACRFMYIKDSANMFSDVVYGAPWYQQQLVFEGASGSIWNNIDATFRNANIKREINRRELSDSFAASMEKLGLAQNTSDAAFGLVNTALNGAEGAIGNLTRVDGKGLPTPNYSGAAFDAVHTMLGMGQITANMAFDQARFQKTWDYNRAMATRDLARLIQEQNENKIGLLRSNKIVSPTVMFTPTDTMSLYGLNKFMTYHITMDDDDVKELDAYFQRYGYNGIHRPLTAACFNTRQYYSYVQAFDVNIKSPFGLRIRQKAISQLNGGVRVWKVLPDAQYYETN